MVVIDNHEFLTQEEKRLREDRHRTKYWKKWGPYVSERQWATGEHFGLFAPIPAPRLGGIGDLVFDASTNQYQIQ